MKESFIYSEESQEPERKVITDFTDEEILNISREVKKSEYEYDPSCGLSYEAHKEYRRALKEKYQIDSATLADICSRARELFREQHKGKGIFSFFEDIEKEHTAQKEHAFEIFKDLSRVELEPREPSQEDRILEALNYNMPSRPEKVSVKAIMKLIGLGDFLRIEIFQEINYQKQELNHFVEKTVKDKSMNAESMQRLYRNLRLCHNIVADHWFSEYANKISVDSVESLIIDPSNTDEESEDIIHQSELLDFALENTTTKQSKKAAAIALSAIEKDFVPYLESGSLVCPHKVTWDNYYEYKYTYGDEDVDIEQLQQKVNEDYKRDFEKEGYHLLGNIVCYGDMDQSRRAREILSKKWPKKKIERFYSIDIVASPYYEFAKAIVNRRDNVIWIAMALSSGADKASTGIDLDILSVVDKLKKTYAGRFPAQNMVGVVGKELAMITELERVIPGSTKRLRKEFGIDFPARYPKEIILEMLEEEVPKPYGIVVYPKADHNVAFHQNVAKLEQLYQQLKKEGYSIKVLEAGSGMDIVKQLLRLNRRYGAKNKVSFMILGGHGMKGHIHFGDRKDGTIYTENIKGQGLRRLADIFTPNAKVILQSCSTGQEGGIADFMSKFFNVNVVAPKNPTSIEEFHVKKTPSGIDIDATYFKDDKSFFKKR